MFWLCALAVWPKIGVCDSRQVYVQGASGPPEAVCADPPQFDAWGDRSASPMSAGTREVVASMQVCALRDRCGAVRVC